MSNNIEHWETLELTDFVLPPDTLECWNEDRISRGKKDPNRITFEMGEDGGFMCTQRPDGFLVNKVTVYGIGSSDIFDFIKEIAPRTTGRFRALLTWEDGDASYLTILDGKAKHPTIDIGKLITENEKLKSEITRLSEENNVYRFRNYPNLDQPG